MSNIASAVANTAIAIVTDIENNSEKGNGEKFLKNIKVTRKTILYSKVYNLFSVWFLNVVAMVDDNFNRVVVY
jgi:hypothetical protein